MTARILTISAALALLGGAPAAAQSNGWFGRPAYGGSDYRAPYQDARRAAHDNGYRDGLKRGEQAARAGRAFNERLEREYRDASKGYNRSYGDRDRYRDDYRGGFAQGYRDGYYRRDSRGQYGEYPDNRGNRGYGNGGWGGDTGYGYGRSDGYGAFQNGAGDGYRKGLEDLEKRRHPDVSRHGWYRSGDHGYDRAYGSRDAYRIEYRRGFEQGYNRAIREGRRW